MAASASHSSQQQQQQQQRCVFVGNIPYDATEEQLIQICEEVGPVVSFRLVIDRETGKPKGYGFCEYKDEETALSARRNLQGYEINGRQLRVDFAENDKNADRNRDQGRGGPGMVTNVDPQRQFGGPAVIGDSTFHQPMGVSAAIAAATSMTRALGAAQTGNLPSQIGQQSHQALGSDPLTLHLAKMSRIQLNEIMFELKAIATQNKEQAGQILLSFPNLPKAIFQAQFMLGMVTEQMLQMPNIRQVVAPPQQPLLVDVQKGQLQVTPTVPGLPPLPPNMQVNLSSQGQETQIFSGVPSSVPSQHATLLQSHAHNQIQFPQLAQNQGLQHDKLLMQPGTSTFPSIRPQPLGNLSVRPHIQVGPSTSLRQQVQVSLPQYPGQIITSGYNPQMSTSLLRSSLPDQGLQASLSSSYSMLDNPNKAPHSSQVAGDSTTPALTMGLFEEGKMVNNRADPTNHSSKLMRLDDGRGGISSMDINLVSSVSRPSPSKSLFEDYLPIGKAVSNSEKQVAPAQLPPEVESALLQQVLNLTPEQLSSLPPDQQQQVIQLQQVLRQSR